MNKRLLLALASVFVFLSSTVSASNELRGCYNITGGMGRSNSIPLTPSTPDYSVGGSEEQIGEYKISLVNARLPRNPRLAFEISGPFKGKIVDDTQLPFIFLKHVLGSSDQTGLIFTSNDIATPTGFPDANGQMPVVETLYPFAGTGKFKFLDSLNSYIEVSGFLNVGTGKNQFEVLSGQLCFI